MDTATGHRQKLNTKKATNKNKIDGKEKKVKTRRKNGLTKKETPQNELPNKNETRELEEAGFVSKSLQRFSTAGTETKHWLQWLRTRLYYEMQHGILVCSARFRISIRKS